MNKIVGPKTLFALHREVPQLQEKSIQTYRNNFNRCLCATLSKRTINEDETPIITPLELVTDWVDSLGSKTRGNANIQRSSLLWALKEDKPLGWEEAFGIVYNTGKASCRADDFFVDEAISEDAHIRTRVKGRVIPEEDLQVIINRLIELGTWGARTQWFLLAGISSGARPGEWIDVVWADPEKTFLRIYTSKTKNHNPWDKITATTFDDTDIKLRTRPHPAKKVVAAENHNTAEFEKRLNCLSLAEQEHAELREQHENSDVVIFRDVYIEPQYRTYVKLHIDSVQMVIAENQNRYPDVPIEKIYDKKYYANARHCLWRACTSIFSDDDRLYSLADTRQTFAANRKAQMGNGKAATELGHTATTSKTHYAPARKAWTKYKPTPSQKAMPKQSELNVEASTADSANTEDSASTDLTDTTSTSMMSAPV